LLLRDGDRLRFPVLYLESAEEAKTLAVQADDRPTPLTTPDFLSRIDRSSLDGRQVDLLLVVPADFGDRLRSDGQPSLYVLTREGDDRSRLVDNRVTHVLRQWKLHLKDVRLRRKGLAPDFDEPFVVQDPARAQAAGKHASDDVFELLVRIFPFVLVMWSLAGALYPAVDLCAGEKERGTMETLLISPASREEIVWGKFLTIWLFSAATALLNLLSMGLTTWLFGGELAAGASFRPPCSGPSSCSCPCPRSSAPSAWPSAPTPAAPRKGNIT
jgi:sodium transport system permease protein